jgi:endonuclease YncB( thermonuclease family)
MRKLLCASVTTSVLLLGASLCSAGDIIGTAGRISDGDTFYVCEGGACTKIRVCGIDAPERGQLGWTSSRDALQALLGDKRERCTPVGEGTVCDGRSKRKSWDRIVAQCFVEGLDIAGPMVADGYACDWAKFSDGHYAARVEAAADDSSFQIHSGLGWRPQRCFETHCRQRRRRTEP